MPEPEPEPTPLARVFDHIYLTAEDSLWALPPLARSKEVLRRVALLSRSIPRPPRFDLAAHPRMHGAEYGTLAVLATVTDAEIDTFLADFHAQYAEHPYPASLFDPAGRVRRWP
jgi:hypothetical protein